MLGNKFIVKTDYRPLQYLQTQAHLSRRQARWVLFLQDFHFDWEYVSGASNRAADALSRQDVDPIHSTWGSLNLYNDASKPQNVISKGSINAMVIVNSETIDQLPSQYADDPDFASLFANPAGSYRVKEGRLFKDNMLCVPRGPLRDTILHDHHDAAVSDHRGFAKTLSSIRRSYFWPTLRKDAENYVKSCDACQRAKALRQPRGGLIRPFPPPMKKWEVISMDFVFDLPVTSSGKSGIAVIVDKLSRQAHFLSLSPKFDAVDLAHLYLHEVYRHHGLPRVLISDRDVRFTSLFWTTLMKRLGVKLNLSTAYHPQTDGQSERTIGTLEDMIRPYVCYLQTDWDQYLDQLEFAYNNSEHTSTGQTPFLVTYGQHPNTMDDVLLRAPPDGEDPPAVQNLLDATERARTLAREAIAQMNSRMAEHVNAHRRDVQFQIGDSVLLSTQNLRLPVGTTRAKKFASR